MLPLHYVLHLTTDDLDLLDQADDYLRIESKNPFANDSTAREVADHFVVGLLCLADRQAYTPTSCAE